MRSGAQPEVISGRRDGLLLTMCWCETDWKPLTPDEVAAGTGWCCHRECCTALRDAHLARVSA